MCVGMELCFKKQPKSEAKVCVAFTFLLEVEAVGPPTVALRHAGVNKTTSLVNELN